MKSKARLPAATLAAQAGTNVPNAVGEAGLHQGAVARAPMFSSDREAEALARRSGARWVGCRVRYFEETDSTNARARRLVEEGWPPGTVVLAEYQTAGRGKLGRRWLCPKGAGLLVSVTVPAPASRGAPGRAWLTAAGALAMAEAVEAACRVRLLIDWPNDLVVPDPSSPEGRRKVGGVLVESAGPAGAAVLGVGLNVDVEADEFPEDVRARAGSLKSVFPPSTSAENVRTNVRGCSSERREILRAFLPALEERLARLGDLAAELKRRLRTLGREVPVPGGPAGRAVDVDADMRLVVELPGGERRALVFAGRDQDQGRARP